MDNDSKEYQEYKECVDEKIKKNPINIKGEFSDFDRIFYQQDVKNNSNFLLLISTKKQLFKRLDLESQQISELNIDRENEYQQVEYYDEKLFGVNRESLTMEIFFSSKKQMLFHKRIIGFANKDLKLKEDFDFTIWKHQEAGMLYRCLMGPLEDGRYMNFDLRERYFDAKESVNATIERVSFIRLELNCKAGNHGNIICTMDETKKSIICFNKDTNKFFEYNGFSGKESTPIYLNYNEKISGNSLKRIYCYHAFHFFSKKDQHQLQTYAREKKQNERTEICMENLYTEWLLCVENNSLIKIGILENKVLAGWAPDWSITNINMQNGHFPVDIAINEYTGEIYCLCSQRIYILKDSGRKIKYEMISDYINSSKKGRQCRNLLSDS